MKQWSIGEKVDFMWMPSGQHTITASYGSGQDSRPLELTVLCDEEAADRVNKSFTEIRANNPRRPPFICVEHKAKERAGEPVGFKWGTIKHDGGEDSGIICTCEPSALGVSNINGKIHVSFSPTFATDAEYHRLVKSANGVWVFPEGARGSRSNPARVTAVDGQSIGSLTNWNAFRDILPIAARQPDGTATVEASGTSEGARKGWIHRSQGSDGSTNYHANEHDALLHFKRQHPKAHIGDWEPNGDNRERKLVWRNKSDSEDDDGSSAIGQIIRHAPGRMSGSEPSSASSILASLASRPDPVAETLAAVRAREATATPETLEQILARLSQSGRPLPA